ncbi:MAG: hypothetical protein M0Z45_09465 [Actinomycetota bacterium]|nr:hypothetical protein [Actinomycetota bacterium]
MWYDGFTMGGPNPFSIIATFLLMVGVFGGGAYLIAKSVTGDKLHFGSSHQSQPNRLDDSDPKVILDRRFANGEISVDQYKEALDLLGYGSFGAHSPSSESI